MTFEENGMRKLWAMIGTCFLLISLGVSGCDQLLTTKPDHITVNIMVAVYATMLDTQNNIVNVTTDWMEVTIIITRNGGDPNIFTRFMKDGLCQATAVMDLAKGQYFECNATIKGQYGEYFVAPGYAKLTWDTVNASENYGDLYSWYPHLTIQMKQGKQGSP
jgi:hypothetical protein